MLNLLLSSCVVVPCNSQLVDCKVVCVDCNSDRLWIITNELILMYIDVQAPNNNKIVTICSLSSNIGLNDNILSMEYLSEMDLLSLSTTNGELYTCNTVTHEIDNVGCVDNGLTCMSWSPDQDVVVMVTGNNTLLIMTRDFDPLTETPIETEEFGEAEPVTVGWGKKETQFHGTLGKKAAQQSTQKVIEPVESWDDHTPLITWRGDGEYFACSTIDAKTDARIFRIFTREGLLHSTSTMINKLERPICWRPSGNLIACCQRKPQSYDIVFYETNGLQHGQFTLLNNNQSEWVVVELLWNTDSTVLGVWLESKTTPKNTTIQLWTTNNYHWYLKQQFCPLPYINNDVTSVTALLWDPIIPLKLHIVTKSGQYIIYQWCKGVSNSSSLESTNNGTVVVIDGVNLLYTPYRHANIPPPLCSHAITITDPILMVAFAPPPNINDFIVVSSKGGVSFIQLDNVQQSIVSKNTFRPVTTPPLIKSNTSLLGKDGHFNIHDLRWLLWIRKDTLVGIMSCDRSHDLYNDVIVEYSISSDYCITEKSRTSCEGHVVCFYGNHNTGSVIAEQQDGSIYYYKDCELFLWVMESGDHVTFGGVSCDQIGLAMFQDKEHVIGLNSRRHQLFINNTKVSSCCTSFVIHNEFIILTTDNHSLRFISTHIPPSTDLNIDNTITTTDESLRRIERGSRIVLAITYDFRVILQMPRGNIETISPRALVLARIRHCLDSLQFNDALIIMRKHRLNLNLICDHNIGCFLNNARLFVEQVNDVNYINLFLIELKSEDVTGTMYPIPSWYRNQSIDSKPHSDTNKVNLICNTLRQVLIDVNENKYALCIITTHIKHIPQQLENVLTIIKKIKDEATPTNNVTADEAMRYVLQLVDVNILYEAALGTYDFDLVLMVAQKSQKDPKEYLPFLNDLKKLPDVYRKYKIDLYLKRYEKALDSITQCGIEKFDECLTLIKEHRLYQQGIMIYKEKSHERHVISMLYADYLSDRQYHRDAAIIYERCGDLDKAYVSYDTVNMWKQSISVLTRIEHNQQKIREKLLKIIGKLKSSGCYSDAARILIDYIKDTEEAIRVLIEGKEWVESYRLINLYGYDHMINELLKPSLLEAHHNQLSYIEQQLLIYTRHVTRLQIVRKEKAEKLKSIMDGTIVADERDIDLFSDIASVTGTMISSIASSNLSKMSNKTAKSRKKTERKKYSLKEGSAHEDIALIEALRQITELSNNLHDETGNIIMMLSLFDYQSEARELQLSFGHFLSIIQQYYSEIWSQTNTGIQPSDAAMVTVGPSSTVNDIIASMKTQQSSLTNNNTTVMAPVLKKSQSWQLTAL